MWWWAMRTPTRKWRATYAVDDDKNVELEVLPGSVESHSDLLAPA